MNMLFLEIQFCFFWIFSIFGHFLPVIHKVWKNVYVILIVKEQIMLYPFPFY